MDRRLAILPAVLLLLAAIHAAAVGVASFLSIEPREMLDRWSDEKWAPLPADLDLEEVRLRNASLLDPGNAELLDDMARFEMMKPPGEGRKIRRELHLLRQSLRARPTSPYSWAMLLFAKSEAGEIDGEYSRAMDNAVLLGPWEPAVQLVVVKAGIGHWRQIDEMQKDEVRQTLLRAMKRQSRNVMEIAHAYKK